MGPIPYTGTYDETDVEAKMHQLEQEAYSSVIRAFKAQADAISWIPPHDIQWEGEDPRISHRGCYGVPGHGLNRLSGRNNAQVAGRAKGLAKGQSRKEFQPSQSGIGKKESDDFQLLHTDSLIKEVERVFSASNPDPLEIEKAKKVLKDHEQALTDAIMRLKY